VVVVVDTVVDGPGVGGGALNVGPEPPEQAASSSPATTVVHTGRANIPRTTVATGVTARLGRGASLPAARPA
jgi:hypothetical protein